MKKVQAVVILASVLSTAALFLGVVFNLYGYHIQGAVAQGKNSTTTTSTKTMNNTLQLSAKEVTNKVYTWINGTNGVSNPTLKVFANAGNIIKIQNPTDTKHELIIDTGSDVLPSSDDINPHGNGQLIFSPNMTGTFTYHCAYHPYTMKGTIQIVK